MTAGDLVLALGFIVLCTGVGLGLGWLISERILRMTHHDDMASAARAVDVPKGALWTPLAAGREPAAPASADGLVEFLTARLNEDEQAAPRVGVVHGIRAVRPKGRSTPLEETKFEQVAVYGPARAQAEVEAKRDILEEVEAMLGGDPYQEGMHAEKLLRLLAGVYRSHPDWREDWAA